MRSTAWTRTAALTTLAALALWAALAASAIAADSTSTITRADCLAGRISRHGKPVSTSECLRHVGQSVKLARTGFDVWIFVLAGAACLAGAAIVRRPRRIRQPAG